MKSVLDKVGYTFGDLLKENKVVLRLALEKKTKKGEVKYDWYDQYEMNFGSFNRCTTYDGFSEEYPLDSCFSAFKGLYPWLEVKIEFMRDGSDEGVILEDQEFYESCVMSLELNEVPKSILEELKPLDLKVCGKELNGFL